MSKHAWNIYIYKIQGQLKYSILNITSTQYPVRIEHLAVTSWNSLLNLHKNRLSRHPQPAAARNENKINEQKCLFNETISMTNARPFKYNREGADVKWSNAIIHIRIIPFSNHSRMTSTAAMKQESKTKPNCASSLSAIYISIFITNAHCALSLSPRYKCEPWE